MGSNFKYREGSINDLDQLLQLAYNSYSEYQHVLSADNWKILEKGLKNKEKLVELIQKATVFVCENDHVIIGAAYIIPRGNPTSIFEKEWCYIRMLAVQPEFRGHGLSKDLTKMCIEHAKVTHEEILALHTSEFMDAARHIYERLGFQKLREIDPIFGKRYWLYVLHLKE